MMGVLVTVIMKPHKKVDLVDYTVEVTILKGVDYSDYCYHSDYIW